MKHLLVRLLVRGKDFKITDQLVQLFVVGRVELTVVEGSNVLFDPSGKRPSLGCKRNEKMKRRRKNNNNKNILTPKRPKEEEREGGKKGKKGKKVKPS
jgi:hypothetical protein